MPKSVIVTVLARSLFPENPNPVMWQIGESVPMPVHNNENTKIIRMFPLEDGSIEVFALPLPGTSMDQNKLGFIFTITYTNVVAIFSLANFGNNDWQTLLQEAVSDEEEDLEDPDDPEEPNENPVEQPPTAPVAPVLSVVPNNSNPSSTPSFIPSVAANLPSIPDSIKAPNQSGT